jgi:hypothetical protein
MADFTPESFFQSRMPISNRNYGVILLLDELHTQCMLFEYNVVRLEDAADHWIKLMRGEDWDRKVPPIDILAWATVCLSAMAAIRRLILDGQAKKPKVAQRRRERVRALLGDPALIHIGSPVVRNAWEHMDERIDELMPQLQAGDAVSHLAVSPSAPAPRTKTLKRFDPNTLTLHFLDQTIPLRDARAEVADLMTRIDNAFARLHTEVVLPWD